MVLYINSLMLSAHWVVTLVYLSQGFQDMEAVNGGLSLSASCSPVHFFKGFNLNLNTLLPVS